MTTAARPLLVIGNRNYSSWSLRAWLFLTHHGVEFDERRLAMNTGRFREEIVRYSPTRRVPVLLHGSVTVWDSLAICEYVGEVLAGEPAWPEAVEARAMARSVACEMHAGFDALRRELPMNCRALDRRVSLSDDAHADVERFEGICRAAVPHRGAGGPWLFGRFSIADAMFAPFASRFLTYGIRPAGPAATWMDTMLSHAGMREWFQAASEESEVIEAEETGEG